MVVKNENGISDSSQAIEGVGVVIAVIRVNRKLRNIFFFFSYIIFSVMFL